MELILISHYLFCSYFHERSLADSPSPLEGEFTSPIKCLPSCFIPLQNHNFARAGQSSIS